MFGGGSTESTWDSLASWCSKALKDRRQPMWQRGRGWASPETCVDPYSRTLCRLRSAVGENQECNSDAWPKGTVCVGAVSGQLLCRPTVVCCNPLLSVSLASVSFHFDDWVCSTLCPPREQEGAGGLIAIRGELGPTLSQSYACRGPCSVAQSLFPFSVPFATPTADVGIPASETLPSAVGRNV